MHRLHVHLTAAQQSAAVTCFSARAPPTRLSVSLPLRRLNFFVRSDILGGCGRGLADYIGLELSHTMGGGKKRGVVPFSSPFPFSLSLLLYLSFGRRSFLL